MRLIDILTILLTVSMTGTEFTVAVILNPALNRLDQATWMKTMPVLAKVMGRVMPFWYGIGLLFIGAEGYIHFHDPARLWLGIAALLWVAGIVYSITVLVPINNRMADAKEGSAASTAVQHQRWDALHRWRVLLLVVATTFVLIGVA